VLARWVAVAAAAIVAPACLTQTQPGHPAPDTTPIYWGVTGEHQEKLRRDRVPNARPDLVLFYQHQLGRYPQLASGRTLHGGIPQKADLEIHLDKLERDIRDRIPDHGFSGVAVIDYESWHPLWDRTPQAYRDASIEHARDSTRGLDRKAIETLARTQYERAARTFLLATLERARALRPEATWGVFALPGVRDDPEDLAWLFRASDAVFPVIYADHSSVPEPDSSRRQAHPNRYRTVVNRAIERASRASELAGGDLRVIPFICLRYRPRVPVIGGRFVNREDLRIMTRHAAERGADALVLWDSIDSGELADRYNAYLRDVLEPTLRD